MKRSALIVNRGAVLSIIETNNEPKTNREAIP